MRFSKLTRSSSVYLESTAILVNLKKSDVDYQAMLFMWCPLSLEGISLTSK